ncbi:dehydrogenase [Bdellovibrio bacteriovorus]|uniref:Dehydrogenase n=1 Tax=Bdellovibrio bacteriovorus TaxID=959 RepID=A0A150WP06_BDEBC|nr:SDR family oxidoreductase [Bdellovibrio bacteriovorus]KYG66037.1 dehydrogenase [Bdellovibrio bacteriovorus]
MNRPRILVTGGTGFLGKRVIPLLREKFEVDVLSRSGTTEVQGDLTQWNAGLNLPALSKKNYALMLHMSGLYDLMKPKADCTLQNVSAMGTALKVADLLKIPYFLSTSTVAAAINSSLNLVKPYDLNFTKPFPDAYSESKAWGEQVLQNWSSMNIKGRINLRLGVLVGDTKKGEIDRIDGPYYAAEAFKKIRQLIEHMPTPIPLPGSEKTRLPFVPVDVAADAIVKFCEWTLSTEPGGYWSYHITPTEGASVTELYSSALKKLAIPNKGVLLVDQLPEALTLKISKVVAKFPEEQLHYLLHFPLYDTTPTREILGDRWCPEFSSYANTFWSGYEKFVSYR